jgi:hypothetical protein
VKNETPDEKRELKTVDENRELKVSSNLQLTTGNNKNEITIKETSFHQGVAVPMSMEDYEKEIAREKDLLNKAKKKISMESSTPKDGISTWILLSGSNNPTTRATTRPEMKPAYRLDNSEEKKEKPVKNGNSTMTTKKRVPVTTTTKMPKPTQKYNNKIITRVKVTSGEFRNETEFEVSTKAAGTTKKVQTTTKAAKKYTTVRPKTTTTATTTLSTTTVDVIDDEEEQKTVTPVETATFLIMEAKEADFNLPSDREPLKAQAKKPAKTGTSTKTKKKKLAVGGTNSTRIKNKSDKKTSTKLSSKKPEKPITTQIYNYLAREVMPTVGVGLVGLVVTAGLATYFLGGPLTALRRSYDISNRRDDIAYDRSDDFGNIQNEEEMFGKVIAGMPENSAYRNNIRVSSYRPKVQQYSGYSQYAQQSPKYAAQQQPQQLRYRNIDPYQNSYQTPTQNQPYPQYYQQQAQAQAQAKSSIVDYANQQQAAQNVQPVATQQQVIPQNTPSSPQFNVDAVDITTNQPTAPVASDYDETYYQSYFPQQDDQLQQQEAQPTAQVTVEQQKMQEVEQKPQAEAQRSERITIVQAQSVPSNHRIEESQQFELPTPAALTANAHADEEYQNSIANAIMSQKKQFVVGSVVAENFEENPPSIVPEHGPRRRRNAVKAAKSLDDNEIDRDDETNNEKREDETSTSKSEETTAKVEQEASSVDATENTGETSSQYPTYNIENTQNNIFNLFRRIIDMKLRLGLNFLQNATVAFQHYLKGVEKRVNSSALFNPYVKNETDNTEKLETSRKVQRKNVESL